MSVSRIRAVALVIASLALASCASSPPAHPTAGERSSRAITEQQRLTVQRVECHAQGMGYKAPPNQPDTHALLIVHGKPATTAEASLWEIHFYRAGDSRLRAPYYDSRTGRFTVFQDIATLPAWLACLTKVATNEGITLNYFCWDNDRYEIQNTRLITSK